MALTKEEERELAELEEQFGGLTPAEEEELAQLEALENPQPIADEPGVGTRALDALGRGLDFFGGVTRTGAAAIADPFVPGEPIGTKEDLIKALQGQAPGTADLLERTGVPAGQSLSDIAPGLFSETGEGLPLERGGFLDPTARGVAGFVGDIALDPLTLATGGASTLAKTALKGAAPISKFSKLAAQPTAEGLKSTGKKIFKSGFKNVDQKLAEKGAEPLSDLLLREGISGSNESVLRQISDINKRDLNIREQLFEQAENAGAKFDVDKAIQPARNQANKLLRNPNTAKAGANLNTRLDNIARRPSKTQIDPVTLKQTSSPSKRNFSLSEASEIKTSFADQLPASAFDNLGRIKGPQSKVNKALQSGFKNEIERSANAAAKGLGDDIADINKQLQTQIESFKPLTNETRKEVRKNAVTSVDAIIGGASVADPIAGSAALTLKKAADFGKTTGFRTSVGKNLINFGKSIPGQTIDPAIRRLLIDESRPPRTEQSRFDAL